MTTNMFLKVAFVVCYGVHMAVASFSSVACWQGGFPREFCCVSGARRVGLAMRPTCTLAVVQDLETHCAGMTRVSMRLVADQSGVPCWTQVM